MPKTVTLELNDQVYRKFIGLAEHNNRPISNFIETVILRYVEEHEYADELEMAEIRDDDELNLSIKRGIRDAKAKRGNFV
ncbi:CopG family transcriptional regulator [Candidatus Thiosymbion oneisti]|uniref:CopG family transcriptional regulator n=1 Tax=Candidatus Thiosymbion oneisti TaxID=589554 RepID=UPI000B7DA574|nr:CopG family transcriptional regulator [Candidatus Thiosymbion oneisti]